MMTLREQIKEVLIQARDAMIFQMEESRFAVYKRIMRLINPSMVLVKCVWTIAVVGPDGVVKQRRRFNNIVTTAGLAHLADHLANGSSAYAMSYLAIGTGTTAEAAGQTALVTEVGTRVAGSKSNPSGAIYRVDGTFGAGNPGTAAAVTEAAIMSASSGGTMLNRKTFSAINKGTSDSLQVTVDVTFAGA